ncbi:MAG: hypothetical protein GYB21_12280 [Oceanospirillales bacterium]|nr:hypothetical protein [Oceanospirillales bacterium]
MLSEKVTEFVSRSMKIDLESVFDRFDKDDIRNYKNELESAVTLFAQAIFDQIESGIVIDMLSCGENPAEVVINQHSVELSDHISSEAAESVLDSLRHAFCSFAFGGLHQLFTRQENEVWYPKIILDEVLEPNDIDALPEIITLYRGTDLAELNSKRFGQSWTTSKDVAREFAFKHYASQSWFKEESRLILSASISREYVYFSNQSCEF